MLRKIVTLFTILTLSISSAWAIKNPVNMLNQTIVETQHDLIKNSSLYSKNPYKLLSLINHKIIPIVNSDVIAQLIVGNKKWKVATKADQEAFIESVIEMLTFMYAKNVAYAGKYNMTLFPFDKENSTWKKKPIVVVNGKITNNDSNKSSDFSVKMFQKNGKWSIYDFDIAGVSILRTYKEQFKPYANVSDMIKAANKVTTRIKKKNYPKLLNKDYKLKNLND